MPNIYVFAVLNVQVRIFQETDKIKLKTKITSTGNGKELSKAEDGEGFLDYGSLLCSTG